MLALEMDLALEVNSEVALEVDLLVDMVDFRVTLEVDLLVDLVDSGGDFRSGLGQKWRGSLNGRAASCNIGRKSGTLSICFSQATN